MNLLKRFTKQIYAKIPKSLKDVAIWWTLLLAPVLSVGYSLKDSKKS